MRIVCVWSSRWLAGIRVDGHLGGRQESGWMVISVVGRNQGCVWMVISVVGRNQGYVRVVISAVGRNQACVGNDLGGRHESGMCGWSSWWAA